MNRSATSAPLAVLALALGALTACTSPVPSSADLEATRGERIAAAYEEARRNLPDPGKSAADLAPGATTSSIPGCKLVAYGSFFKLDDGLGWVAQVIGQPRDRGPRNGANGDVMLDENGHPIAYTVAEGDMLNGISGRFCFEVTGIGQLNNIRLSDTIHPGQRLLLAPDPENPWEPLGP